MSKYYIALPNKASEHISHIAWLPIPHVLPIKKESDKMAGFSLRNISNLRFVRVNVSHINISYEY